MTAQHRDVRFFAAVLLVCAGACALPFVVVHAQTPSQDQLRATIKTEIMADPRSQNLSQAQIQSMVNALAAAAQKQGVTAAQLSYRPPAPAQNAPDQTATAPTCGDLMCAFSHAFGLDGSAPWIIGGLFVCATLFIFLFSKMREMGHPHAQLPGDNPST